MNLILFDDNQTEKLYPLTFTRPAAEIRCGILTISEKWKNHLKTKAYSYHTAEHLSKKYPAHIEADNLLVNGRLLPNSSLLQEIQNLKTGQWLTDGEYVLAGRSSKHETEDFIKSGITKETNTVKSKFSIINQSPDIFSLNDSETAQDFLILTQGRSSQKLSASNRYTQSEHIFIEEGAKVEFATLNPNGGYIYIGRNAEIMENSSVRGSFSMGKHSVLKMGAKVYGASTLGNDCKVGGEINNTVFFAYSNKAHDGFLGNAVIGEWCNLGADTNNSNLKNNYEQVKLWNYSTKRFEPTGLQFCGLIMGDHSKCGINTMFNTGTIVGVSTNIFGSGFPRNFIPSFSWGGAHGFTEYKLNKALKTAEIMMARRNITLDKIEKDLLSSVFDMTKQYRR